jgi:cobalt-zinc-cadmium efflux system membrane fusion protein
MTRSSARPPRDRRSLLLVLGALGLVGVSVAGTVAVEHRLHGHGLPGRAEHEEHAGESESDAARARVRLSPEMIENARIEMARARAGRVLVMLSLPGEVALNSERVAHVTPRVGGSVRETRKKLGDTVKKGDVLAVLDSRELAEMQRDLLSARERLELAESSFRRQEQLFHEKISAEKDYLAAKQVLAEAKIEHRAASQKLAAGAGAKAGGGGLMLTAPLEGTIIEKHAVVGEVLSDTTLAFVIADLSTLWVDVTVYAKDLPRVQLGQKTIVRAEGIDEPAFGEVSYIDRVMGEATRSATARVVLTQPPPKWRPGLFATAEIVTEEVDVPLVVTHDAVQRVDGKEVVFVESAPGVFDARAVGLGRRGFPATGEREPVVELIDGIEAGQRYAAKNSFLLKAELGKSEAGHEH